ncbi:orotate phosphoribosyltransferase [Acidipila sp. EB88]|uniref:orotate phosphoribosyltransferase n=1 Tax=Acidipila sp. EB88 TaxID=2305226 RepID=UPI000F603091|nr:orotate phosphoribosyltransferase [Acidipila sp. EB88]RRA49703.1 orotate phosphoribosyltransferase [Acidipila sp. EB88]
MTSTHTKAHPHGDADPRTKLLSLLAKISFKLGSFQLSSGATSDYYIDCRITTLHAEGGRLCGLALFDLLHAHSLRPAAVGGLTMGADPVVSAIAIASAQRGHEDSTQPLVHGFLVRKEEKAHGMKRRIEGFFEPGAPVVIVDDVCTTGASTIDAIEAARAAGFQVIGAACLVERTEAAGRGAVEAALGGAPFFALFTANDVRKAHVAQLPL